MTREDLADLVRTSMSEAFYTKPGAVLLAAISCIRPANAYVMGLNPGGDPQEIPGPLINALAPAEGTGGYTHECWQPKCPGGSDCTHMAADGSTKPEALVKHQRSMASLASALGEMPETLCSANAVFGRSSSKVKLKAQTGYTLSEWWQACWPVHQQLLAIVRPRMIVTLGYGAATSAFGLLHKEAGFPPWRKFSDEGARGGWIFDADLPLRSEKLRTSVISVPHPSYFAPGPILSEMLREFAEGRLCS